MKQILLILSLLMAVPSFAQKKGELIVSEIKGSMQMQQGKTRSDMKVGQRFEGNKIILLEENSMAIVLEPKEDKRYMLKGPWTGSVRNYIQRYENSCVKVIGKKYMIYLLSQALSGNHEAKGREENSHATVFRKGDILDDSITISLRSMDSLYRTIDSLSVIRKDSVQVDSIKKK
jgi:hypothetical protein